MLGSGGGGNALINKSAAQVVNAGGQKQLGHPAALFYPGSLNVGYPIVQHDSGDGMNFHHVHSGWAGADVIYQPLEKHGSFTVYKTEGNKFGYAAGLLLNIPYQSKMPRQMLIGLHVSKHNRGSK